VVDAPPPSCFWALLRYAAYVDERPSTDLERRGLTWARQLAEDALQRRTVGPQRAQRLPKLTPRDIAFSLDVTDWAICLDIELHVLVRRPKSSERLIVRYVEDAIAAARERMFDRLSDRAIYVRAQRGERRAQAALRPCAVPGCGRALPRTAPSHRRYCDVHGSPSARARRYQTAQADAAA
jgi:hypothetical protein